MKSEEQISSALPPVYKGSMLPVVDVGPDRYDDLFEIALACVSEVTGTEECTILGRDRAQPYPVYRFMLYKIVRHEIGTGSDSSSGLMPTLQWIGEKMGMRNPKDARDHGSVLHGVKALEEFLESDRRIEPVYMRVLARFEIARAEYLSLMLDETATRQIRGLKQAAATIARAIKNHEAHLASVMEKLAKAELERINDEDMVQDKCSSDG